MGRTSSAEAIERIAWYLNYSQEDNVPVNQVAEATNLSWATVRKYAQAIESQQRIAPQLEVNSDGISVGQKPPTVGRLFSNSTRAFAVYLLNFAELEGEATEPISIEEHAEIFDEYSDAVEKMEGLGWIEIKGETIQLTPLGVRIAGSERAEVMDSSRDQDPQTDLDSIAQSTQSGEEPEENEIQIIVQKGDAENKFDDDDNRQGRSINPETAAATV
jgi:hypothetical protein